MILEPASETPGLSYSPFYKQNDYMDIINLSLTYDIDITISLDGFIII